MAKTTLHLFLFLLLGFAAKAQVVLDKTIAKIGDQYILLSDLEYRYREEVLAKGIDTKEAKCDLLFTMIREKMLIVQADRDSIEVSPDEIDMQMEQRMAFFIQQFGSEKAIEKYFNESMANIRAKLRKTMEDQMIVNKMQQKLLGDVKISPNEVRTFYRNLPQDSMPDIKTQYEVGQVVLNIPVSTKEKRRVKRHLNKIRNQIISGDLEWSIAATLYSEDPGSKARGGDLGWAPRSAYVPEFSAAAFKLKKDSISGPIETQFGYHIIQMLDRKGDRIHVRHILISPKPRPENRRTARSKLDSIRKLILRDSFTFKTAAYKFSQDEETRNTGGMLYDAETGSTKISNENIPIDLSILLDTMKVGLISLPLSFMGSDNKEAYRIIYLKSKILAHKANLTQDYAFISDLALNQKNISVIINWTWQKAPSMYISIADEYHSCKKIRRLIAENKRNN